MYKYGFSRKESRTLEREVWLEAVDLFAGEVGDDLVVVRTVAAARHEQEQRAQLRVRGLRPGVSRAVRPADEQRALLLALSEECLPAGVLVLGTRQPPVTARAILLLLPALPVYPCERTGAILLRAACSILNSNLPLQIERRVRVRVFICERFKIRSLVSVIIFGKCVSKRSFDSSSWN